jgi:hypothetical protein
MQMADEVQLIPLTQVDIYGGTQTRVSTNEDAVASYAEEMAAGSVFPPITLYYDGAKYWLADGFHRFLAAQRLDFTEIEAEVKAGARGDALKFALGANATNGLYRSHADKRNAVEIALEEWPQLSNSVLSELCKVSDELVRRCRHTMEKLQRIEPQHEVVGKDGKRYSVQSERRASHSESAAGGASTAGGAAPRSAKKSELAAGGSHAELEAEARKLIREGEVKHADLDRLSSATALDYAETALNVLNRMPLDDPRRPIALQRVQAWLESQQLVQV